MALINRDSAKLFSLTNPIHLLATGFGSGLLKPAPGTWGTAVAVPMFFLLSALVNSLSIYIIFVVLISLAGIKICDQAAKDAGVHDHKAIVWDEIAGFLIAMIAVPATFFNAFVAFLLFRFFDIVKPWPIGYIDRKVSGGFGIMLDDILAGIFSLLCMHILLAVL